MKTKPKIEWHKLTEEELDDLCKALEELNEELAQKENEDE